MGQFESGDRKELNERTENVLPVSDIVNSDNEAVIEEQESIIIALEGNLTKMSTSARAEFVKHAAERTKIIDDNAKLTARLQKYHNLVGELVRDKNALEYRLETFSKNNVEADKNEKDYFVPKSKLENENNGLKEKMSMVLEENSSMRIQLVNETALNKAKIIEQEKNFEEKDTKIIFYENRINNLIAQVQSSREQTKTISEKLEITGNPEEHTRELKEALSQVALYKGQIDHLVSKIEKKCDNEKHLTDQLKDARHECEEKVRLLEKHIVEIEGNYESLNNQVARTRKDFISKNEVSSALKNENQALKTNLESLTNIYSEMKSKTNEKFNDHEIETCGLKGEITVLKGKSEKMKEVISKNNSAYIEKLEEIVKKFKESKTKNTELLKRLKKFQEEKKSIIEMNNNLKKVVKKLSSKKTVALDGNVTSLQTNISHMTSFTPI